MALRDIITTCRRQSFAVVVCVIFGAATGEPASSKIVTAVRAVALSETPVPGVEPDYQWSTFNLPVINDVGHVAFAADVRGPNPTTSGLWSEAGGAGLQLVARERYQAPGTPPGTVFNGLNLRPFQYNNQSAVGFFRGVSGPGVTGANDGGIWTQRNGGVLELVVRETDPAPGTAAGQHFGGLTPPAMNHHGDISFVASLVGPGINDSNRYGIWTDAGDQGNLRLLVRTGQQAPGTPVNVRFELMLEPLLNTAGEAAFVSALTGPGVNTTNNTGIWIADAADSIRLVARKGAQAPSLPSGTQFGHFGPYDMRFNEAGQTAFHSRLQGAGVNNNNDESIWFESADNQLVLVARENDPAPGVPGAIFSGLLSASALNDAGQLMFISQLAGPGVGNDERAYWLYDSGGLTLVARERNPAPGMGPGWSFQDFFGAALNNHGQMVFGASAVNGVQFTHGIWALEPGGDLRLVVRSDDKFDVDNGPGVDLRSIFSIDFLSNSTIGHPDGFNDRNELVVEVVFNEPSHGIFVLAIPEPNTFTISLCACIALAGRRIALCNGRNPRGKTRIDKWSKVVRQF